MIVYVTSVIFDISRMKYFCVMYNILNHTNMRFIVSVLFIFFSVTLKASIKEKTLVVWVSNISVEAQGGSVICLDNNDGKFDAIVLGEVLPKTWMAGSENWNRTQKNQGILEVKFRMKDLVQIAVTYSPSSIALYRNGEKRIEYKLTSELLDFNEESIVLFGLRHILQGDNSSFNGEIEDARIYDSVLDEEYLKSLQPNVIKDDKNLWAWWNFEKDEVENTGRFNYAKLVNGAFVTRGALILPTSGACLYAFNQQNFVIQENSLMKTSFNTHVLRDSLLKDKHRPAYHFVIPEGKGVPFDPNGAFYYQGRYHLMYLYDRKENGGFAWGHVSSKDLLHWRFHPDALVKGDGDEGVFSGGAYVDSLGNAVLSYWMLWGAKGIGLAKSSAPDFDVWEKAPQNPIIKSTEWGITDTINTATGERVIYGSADPSNIWKKGDKYYMLTGNLLVLEKYGRKENSPEDIQGDHLYLFESKDLVNWTYLHEFYKSDRKWTDKSEDNMCPSFLPLPQDPEGGAFSGKYLLLSISHNKGCRYYIGTYKDDKFYPDSHQRMSWVDNTFFAPEALIDNAGRQIMWAWVFDYRPESRKESSGWDGMYCLPRTLWLREDGTLGIKPVQELEMLRYNPYEQYSLEVPANEEIILNQPQKELMELKINFMPSEANIVGVKVCCSEDGREETFIYYDKRRKKLNIDVTKSSISYGTNNIESAPLELADSENLELQIFVDKGIVEVFANGKQAIARPIYPMLGGHIVKLVSQGERSIIKSVNSWSIAPSNPY